MSEKTILRLKPKSEGGVRSYRHSTGISASQKDPYVEVDESTADYLLETAPFERASEADIQAMETAETSPDFNDEGGAITTDNLDPSQESDADPATGSPPPTADDGDESSDGGSDGDAETASADENEDDGESLSYEEFSEQGYQDRVDDVESGRVDAHLNRIIDEDGSTNVVEAAEARKDERE